MNPQLILMGTESCHLCELAAHMLAQMGIHPVKLDIMDLADGVDRYGMRIPVLIRPDQAELAWPFSLLDIERWSQELLTSFPS